MFLNKRGLKESSHGYVAPIGKYIETDTYMEAS